MWLHLWQIWDDEAGVFLSLPNSIKNIHILKKKKYLYLL